MSSIPTSLVCTNLQSATEDVRPLHKAAQSSQQLGCWQQQRRFGGAGSRDRAAPGKSARLKRAMSMARRNLNHH